VSVSAHPRFSFSLSGDGRKAVYLLVLFLLIAAVLGNAVFAMTEPFSDLVVIISLVAFALAMRPSDDAALGTREKWLSRARYAALFLAAATAIRLLDGPIELLVFALFLCGVDLLRTPGADGHRDLPGMQLTLLLYAVFVILQDRIPYVSSNFDSVARGYSHAASTFVPGDVSIGQGYLGLRLAVLFLLYALSLAVFAKKKSIIRLTAAAGIALLCVLAYAIAWGWIAGNSTAIHFAMLLEPFGAAHDYRLLLFALLIIPIAAYRLSAPPREIGAGVVKRALSVAAALAVVLAVASFLMIMQPASGGQEKRVIVLDSAGNMATDLPTFKSLGTATAGQFGQLPTYLKQSGYDVEVVKEITPELLKQTGTLVMINLRKDFTEDESRAIWEFVDAGGSLLLLGDHTGTKEIRDPSNKLLEPVGISLNFDSAIPVRDGWPNGYDLKPHPISAGISGDEVNVAIGASLRVTPPARAVLVGRAGYSDAGNFTNAENGFLGDMVYNPGEQMGDVILVADATYGRGRVLVFGDTTLVQNGVLARSYRFVDNIFAWMAGRSDATLWAIISSAAAVVLVAGVGLVVLRAGSGIVTTALPTIAMAVVLVVSGIAARPTEVDQATRERVGRRAVVDVSHFELGRLDRSIDALDGLLLNFVRNDYTPFVMREFSSETIDGAEVLVLPAPMQPFSPAEMDVIDAFMEGGGLLVVTAGSERPSAPYALLSHFGFELGGVPLGRADATSERWKASLWGAWPIKQEVGGGADVIAKAWEYPVMLYRQRGAGGVLVVADSAFLMNKNLEDAYTFSEENILFLRDFLTTYGGGK
jgi:hypothetical protein